MVLKVRLLDLFTPKPMDQSLKLSFGGELGDRRPSQLMEYMLALLPPVEKDSLLFKTLFLTSEVRDHVVASADFWSSREMSFSDLNCENVVKRIV